MVAGKALWFSSSHHAHAGAGMAPDVAKVWRNEFASATEGGHTSPTPAIQKPLDWTGNIAYVWYMFGFTCGG